MEPLVPAGVDLRDFAYLPMDVVRLRDSGLAVEASGDEFRAAVLLWCVAWHQIPAASLPEDDRVLAMYAGFGRDTKGWRKVRTGALRGFERASDGRLYHRVLAEKANEAWESKLRLRHRRECERIKKSSQRSKTEPVYPSFDEWKEHLIATGSDQWSFVPRDMSGTAAGTIEGRPGSVPRESLPLKGKGNGEGIGEREGKVIEHPSSLRSDSSAPSAADPAIASEVEKPEPEKPELKLTPPAEIAERTAIRIREITADAVASFNAVLGKPNGLLPSVHLVNDVRQEQVRRCIPVARAICERLYGASTITRRFWDDYFAECARDPFLSGQRKGGKDHEGYVPEFELFTRKGKMSAVFDKAMSEDAA
jgi:hypothetical protein